MPALPTLLPLSELELSELFGEDSDGLRRYRLLHAVLVDGLTQRQAAERSEVSERTVRNILRAYTQAGGLEALRSRPTNGRSRRDRRTGPVERALAAALVEEPLSGGDRLWRRAQELLGEEARTLSRRTAYRLLAQLRQEQEEDAPDSLRGAVRSALPLLLEDPPLTLGGSALAQRFLPADLDTLPRGMLLQQALRDALDHLRPAGAISAIDRSWWPYLICTGEYETGETRTEIQDDLALSASTYSRAKRQGIDRIAAVVPQIIARMIESPAALASQRLPRTPEFVGRRDEQSYYAWQLQAEGVAHLWGLPGSGKTALAAELAADGHRYGQAILWHDCRSGRDSTLLGIIRGLAQALVGTGDDMLWRELRQTPADQLDIAATLEALRERLLVRPVVIVLDDIHHADAEEIGLLLDALADLVARRSIRLLLVGRDPIESLPYAPLPGMIEREAQLLWAGGVALPADQWRALYAMTGGMPDPIRRASAAYRRAGELARPYDWIDEVDRWARDTIWPRFDSAEQRLLTAAYALAQQPWSEHTDLVLEILHIPAATLKLLSMRGLLHPNGGSIMLYGALANIAAAQLQADDVLRDQVSELVAKLHAVPLPIEQLPVLAEPAPDLRANVDLLARLRTALEHSAEYLQTRHDDDQIARQLAAELAALQAVLPNLPMAPPPFGQPVARMLAT